MEFCPRLNGVRTKHGINRILPCPAGDRKKRIGFSGLAEIIDGRSTKGRKGASWPTLKK